MGSPIIRLENSFTGLTNLPVSEEDGGADHHSILLLWGFWGGTTENRNSLRENAGKESRGEEGERREGRRKRVRFNEVRKASRRAKKTQEKKIL